MKQQTPNKNKRLTPQQKLAQVMAMKAKAETQIRKLETRGKIVMGARLIAAAKGDELFARALHNLMAGLDPRDYQAVFTATGIDPSDIIELEVEHGSGEIDPGYSDTRRQPFSFEKMLDD